MRSRIFVVQLSIIFLVGLARSQDSPRDQNDVAQDVQQLMDLELGFEQMVPSGMSIEAKEISRQGTSSKDLVVQYHIFVRGAPPNALFQWIQWPVNADKPSSPLEGISVGKDGILMCAGRAPEQCGDPKKPDDPIEFVTMPKKAEPTRVAFVSPTVKVGTVIVPDPIETTDKGCTLSAVRLTPKFELALLSGYGFPPNTDVRYRISAATTTDHVIKSDSRGTIRFSATPYAAKTSKGTVTVTVMGTKCSPEVSYEWGTI